MMASLKIFSFAAAVAVTLFAIATRAQQPTPPMVVVQPAAPVITPAPAAAAPASSSDGTIASAIKTLEQVKAANDATLKKQEEMLQQLDELQKAAEQLKVFSKRV